MQEKEMEEIHRRVHPKQGSMRRYQTLTLGWNEAGSSQGNGQTEGLPRFAGNNFPLSLSTVSRNIYCEMFLLILGISGIRQISSILLKKFPSTPCWEMIQLC